MENDNSWEENGFNLQKNLENFNDIIENLNKHPFEFLLISKQELLKSQKFMKKSTNSEIFIYLEKFMDDLCNFIYILFLI